MKKKILISAHTLRLGGVERSFLGILQSIDFSKYDVDVFLHKHDGELLKFLPNEVNLLPENKNCRLLLEPIFNSIKSGYFRAFFIVLWGTKNGGRGVFLRFASQKKRRSPCRPRRLRADRAGIGSVGEPEGREP